MTAPCLCIVKLKKQTRFYRAGFYLRSQEIVLRLVRWLVQHARNHLIAPSWSERETQGRHAHGERSDKCGVKNVLQST